MYFKALHHENIVNLYEIIQDVDKIVLIFEFADMDLKKYLDKIKGGIKDVKLIQSFILPNFKWIILLQYK